MTAPNKNTPLVLQSKAVPNEHGTLIIGTHAFQVFHDHDPNDLNHIESQVEHAGQDFKRLIARTALEAADQQCSQLLKSIQPHLIKNGTAPFTIVARFGEVLFQRQRLLNKQTGTTLTPSAILWQTSQRRHITQAAIDAACDTSQDVSYRKTAKKLAEEAGVKQLISASTVWNKKQEKGKEIEKQQNDFVQQVQSGQEVALPAGVPSNSTRRIEEGAIQVQLDEIKTKSQEPDKSWNLTYTATIETSDKQCYRLAARSVQQLTMAVMAYLTMLGYLNKRLEVLSDGATWISDWVSNITEVPVEQILCWYHLQKRVYESLTSLGFAKERRKLLEREILGLLWKGRTAQAVWILWGLRSRARVPERIDGLMGYLLRKKRIIVDYGSRYQEKFWVASTRVEGWNDMAVADRCKKKRMSWTANGVLAVALYAAKKMHTTT